MIRIFFLLLLFTTNCLAAAPESFFAIAERPTPVLNSPNFRGVFGGRSGKTLKTDGQGLIREVEFIALPGTVFTVNGEMQSGGAKIYRVTTGDYPYPARTGYFIDARFVRPASQTPTPREKTLPPFDQIMRRLLSAQGSPYVWGGNLRGGIPDLLDYYPPAARLSPADAALWQLEGLDCSGLLYEATGGFTPRNTSSLANYGKGVPIAGLPVGKLVERLEPLDLIVWPGHVIIVLDRQRTIESRLSGGKKGGGVVVRPLRQVLEEIMATRRPVDSAGGLSVGGKGAFVIRRWFEPEMSR